MINRRMPIQQSQHQLTFIDVVIAIDQAIDKLFAGK